MADNKKPPFIFMPETDAADRLINQADAFLLKHRSASPVDDDMPVLTEVVGNEELDPDNETTDATIHAADPPAASAPDRMPADFVEQLIELDAVIAHRIDNWLQSQLPALIDAQVDAIKRKLREEIHAQMRATLIADISRDISDLLDANDPRDR